MVWRGLDLGDHAFDFVVESSNGSWHLSRHACATLMLGAVAAIRGVQEFLGHEKPKTTQIHSHVRIRMLKEVHTQTHPARLTAASENAELDAELAEEAR